MTQTKSTGNVFFSGTGRRKRATARVWLYDKKGEFVVNGVPIQDYFAAKMDAINWYAPFHAIGIAHPISKYSATIKVSGGGLSGQLEAIILGIARALLNMDVTRREALRSAGLLTRDARRVYRKLPFRVKSRKKPQFSKR